MRNETRPASEQAAGKAAQDQPQVRRNEAVQRWQRRERVFSVHDSWYFRTREGVDVGPYACRFDAELELDLLIRRLRDAPQTRSMGIVRNHALDAQTTTAGSLNSPAFTDYLVEIGGVEILRRSD